jgi:hypothetical protein
MASKNQSEAQYNERFTAQCQCGESIWRRVEWAHKMNEEMERKSPHLYQDPENINAGYIVIKNCKKCSDYAKKQYENS